MSNPEAYPSDFCVIISKNPVFVLRHKTNTRKSFLKSECKGLKMTLGIKVIEKIISIRKLLFFYSLIIRHLR